MSLGTCDRLCLSRVIVVGHSSVDRTTLQNPKRKRNTVLDKGNKRHTAALVDIWINLCCSLLSLACRLTILSVGLSSPTGTSRWATSPLPSCVLIETSRLVRLAASSLQCYIHSKGLCSIRSLPDCGYCIIIRDILYVPSFPTNLFTSDKFARHHRDMVVDSPVRRWVNRLTVATGTIWPTSIGNSKFAQ